MTPTSCRHDYTVCMIYPEAWLMFCAYFDPWWSADTRSWQQ